MMSISIIAPAFASPPWKDLYECESTNDGDIAGTYEWVKDHEGCGGLVLSDDRITCPTKSGAEGHKEFKDLKPYDGELSPGEQERCHKTSFWP